MISQMNFIKAAQKSTARHLKDLENMMASMDAHIEDQEQQKSRGYSSEVYHPENMLYLSTSDNGFQAFKQQGITELKRTEFQCLKRLYSGMTTIELRLQYKDLFRDYYHNLSISDGAAIACLLIVRSLLLPKAQLVIRTFSQLSQEVQDSLLTDQCSSPEEILEKSGYNKAEQQQKLREQASDPPLLPQERQKRSYSHDTVGKDSISRGIEKTWAGRQAAEKVLKENGVNAHTTYV